MTTKGHDTQGIALRFVIMVGVLSLFADFTYEGSRSIIGPYLATLQASGKVVSIVTGFGELLGYALRLLSGRLTDSTSRYWAIAIFGYAVQMGSVPTLALTDSWPAAAVLIILERVGKAIRNPSRDAMLSHAGRQIGGYGWAFGLHQAFDQLGAVIGPLAVAAVLAYEGSYRPAFAVLLLPAIVNLSLVWLARFLYPTPQAMEVRQSHDGADRQLPIVFWVYLTGAALIAGGFADYALIAFNFGRTGAVPGEYIAVFYAVAMAISGAGSLVLGKLFDRFGVIVLVIVTAVSALFAPLVFLGDFWTALIGAAIWGLGTGFHESIIPAVVAPMVSPQRRASAFGLFTAGYGISWFVGSAIIGVLYDVSLAGVIAFCLVSQFSAIPIFVWVARRMRTGHTSRAV